MDTVDPPFQTAAVARAYGAFSPAHRAPLLVLRHLILDTAAGLDLPDVQESLKWGQPSYTTAKSTPIRLGVAKTGDIAILTHCQSSVIPDFRALFPEDFQYDGNRALILGRNGTVPARQLRLLIQAALAYRL